MKLQRVHSVREPAVAAHFVRTICVGCRAAITMWEAYADLEGEPWVDYYCQPCAAKAGQHDGVQRSARGSF